MSLFTREAKSIKIEKVSNGFVLRVFKSYDMSDYEYGTFKRDQIYKTVEELVAAIQENWKPEVVTQ